jgi:anhydro-N-acetylmuramic acid kinase
MGAVCHNIGQIRYGQQYQGVFMSNLYIGLMSGTSVDGIDAALVDFSGSTPILVASHYTPYTLALRKQILGLCYPGENEIERLGELDVALAKVFATAVETLLLNSSTSSNDIAAIGSHGQTVRHAPHLTHRFTMQIGDPNTIAAQTGITTVADFRRKDIALGGQGAPLVPAFHRSLFASKETARAIVNIGGIANITLLPTDAQDHIIGFDTGPGNSLLDYWINKHKQTTHDQAGTWGASGRVHQPLLDAMLADAYFKLTPPKSTGREYFNHQWLQNQLSQVSETILPADVQATLTELTATTIVNAVKTSMNKGEILACGGGTHNLYLMSRLRALSAPEFTVTTTETYGVHPDWVEATAFAWLAFQTMQKRTGNLPSVTGAKHAAILGGVYYAD